MTFRVQEQEKNAIHTYFFHPVFIVITAFVFICSPRHVFSEEPPDSLTKQALVAIQHEDYEEAVASLEDLRAAYPDSPSIAYYLGLAYKRLQNYQSAEPHLLAAVSAEKPVPEAFPEVIELLYQRGDIDKAKQWIAAAEQREIINAQVLFLKGLVLAKEGKDLHLAIDAFEEVLWFDKSFEPSVKYQLAILHAQMKNYSQAETFLRDIIVKDPATDLASYANEYIDALDRQRRAAGRFHGSFGYALQFDDNVVAVPTDDLLSATSAEKDDWQHLFTAQGDYALIQGSPFSLKAGYSFTGLKHDSIGFYDSLTMGVPINPAFYFDRMVIAFPLQYSYTTVNERRYLETWSVGSLNNFLLERDNMLQVQAQYTSKRYRWSPTVYDDEKSGREYLGAAAWYHFLGPDMDGFWNLRYALSFDDACGQNWRSLSNRFTFSLVLPLRDRLKWNCVLDYVRDDYLKQNSGYGIDRLDDVVTVSNLFSYEFMRDTELQLQHSYIDNSSSIAEYKYEKQVYSVGLKYRF